MKLEREKNLTFWENNFCQLNPLHDFLQVAILVVEDLDKKNNFVDKVLNKT